MEASLFNSNNILKPIQEENLETRTYFGIQFPILHVQIWIKNSSFAHLILSYNMRCVQVILFNGPFILLMLGLIRLQILDYEIWRRDIFSRINSLFLILRRSSLSCSSHTHVGLHLQILMKGQATYIRFGSHRTSFRITWNLWKCVSTSSQVVIVELIMIKFTHSLLFEPSSLNIAQFSVGFAALGRYSSRFLRLTLLTKKVILKYLIWESCKVNEFLSTFFCSLLLVLLKNTTAFLSIDLDFHLRVRIFTMCFRPLIRMFMLDGSFLSCQNRPEPSSRVPLTGNWWSLDEEHETRTEPILL